MSFYAAILPLGAVAAFVAVLTLWTPVRRLVDEAVRRYRAWAEHMIAALHLDVTAGDIFVRHLLAVVAALFVGYWLGGGISIVGLGALALFAPKPWLARAIVRRRQLLEAQLDNALQTLANNMLATQNLVEGFATLARNLAPPLSQEADLVVKDVRVGARIDEALRDLGVRCQSQYVDAVVTALTIGIRTGGDLGKVLKTIAAVVRETMRVEGVMAAKTQEGKTSAWVLGCMPPFFTIVVQRINPDFLTPLWVDPIGNVMVALAVVSTLAGVALVIKISTLDA